MSFLRPFMVEYNTFGRLWQRVGCSPFLYSSSSNANESSLSLSLLIVIWDAIWVNRRAIVTKVRYEWTHFVRSVSSHSTDSSHSMWTSRSHTISSHPKIRNALKGIVRQNHCYLKPTQCLGCRLVSVSAPVHRSGATTLAQQSWKSVHLWSSAFEVGTAADPTQPFFGIVCAPQ